MVTLVPCWASLHPYRSPTFASGWSHGCGSAYLLASCLQHCSVYHSPVTGLYVIVGFATETWPLPLSWRSSHTHWATPVIVYQSLFGGRRYLGPRHSAGLIVVVFPNPRWVVPVVMSLAILALASQPRHGIGNVGVKLASAWLWASPRLKKFCTIYQLS